MRRWTMVLFSVFLFLFASVWDKDSVSKFPCTEAGAKAFLSEFIKSGADVAALSKPLRPTAADYKVGFSGEYAKLAEDAYNPSWGEGKMIVAASKPE